MKSKIASASVSISVVWSYGLYMSPVSKVSTVYVAEEAAPTIISPSANVPLIGETFNFLVTVSQDLTLACDPVVDP